MKYYLTILRPARAGMLTGGPTDDEARAVARHFDYLRGLCEQGVVLLAGRTQTTDPGTIGLVVFQSIDDESARRLAAADPAVAAGVMTADVRPFGIALPERRHT